MEFVDLFAGPNDNDRTLEKIIRKLLTNVSLSQIYKSSRNGLFKINDKIAKLNNKVYINDKISLPSFLMNISENNNLQNNNKQYNNKLIDIFCNENFRIISKPYGINVHSASKNEISLDKIIKNEYKSIHHNNNSISFAPGPLHRLDKNTTGILVFSQSLDGARSFSNAMKHNALQKHYLTILCGKLEKNLHLRHYLKKSDNNQKFHTVDVFETNIYNSTLAITNVFPIDYGKFNNKFYTFAKVHIETGKTHQIRSQCSYAGFPLFADIAYGGEKNIISKDNRKLFLHAFELENINCNELSNNGFPKKIICGIGKEFENILKNFLPKMDIKTYNISSYEIVE
ncbi:MAG: RluA family pseudouridine synthase [Treponema sp.]|nr:RluA family pseudouridine synthase [Treponema sp.]